MIEHQIITIIKNVMRFTQLIVIVTNNNYFYAYFSLSLIDLN